MLCDVMQMLVDSDQDQSLTTRWYQHNKDGTDPVCAWTI